MMEKLTFGRHAAKQLVAQIDISQKKFYILFIKVDTPKYAKYGQICMAYLGIHSTTHHPTFCSEVHQPIPIAF